MTKFNPSVARISPYKPGKPIGELTRELGLTDIVKLASNENPRGPGPAVREAVRAAAEDLTRYPDGGSYELKAAIAAKHNVAVEQITVGAGSNEVIDLLARAILEPGSSVVVSEHTFVAHALATLANGGELVEAPVQNYRPDPQAIIDAIDANTRAVFLANPNNPTGTYLSQADLVGLLERIPGDVWVLLDEAYFEYVGVSDYPDGMTLLERFENLVVTRTFSKIHGLASLRIGYGVSNLELADRINRARLPFNTTTPAQAAALAALMDNTYAEASRALNVAGYQQLTSGLERLGISYIASIGNFVTAHFTEPGPAVFERMLREGVILRPVVEYGLPNSLRITIGTEHENARCLDALARVL